MPIQRLSDEQLHKLTPEERIKYLRALEEEQKKTAEEAKRKADEEIRMAEELIKRSQEEIEEEALEEEEEERRAKEARQDAEAKEERKKESIDDLLGGERSAAQGNGQYRTDRPDYTPPGQGGVNPLYATLETAASELDRLAGKTNWDPTDQRQYQDAKQQIERVGQYQLSSDRLQEELGLAQHAFNRLKYQH